MKRYLLIIAALLCAGQVLADGITESDRLFIQFQAGEVFPRNDEGTILVNNGSGFPPPLNVDRFSVRDGSEETYALTVGKRYATHSNVINHYTISARFQYVPAHDVGHTITEYSLPVFLNYNYDWKLSTFAVTADTKINLFNFSRFLPYVNGGLGIAFNKADSYLEIPLPLVTTRITPGYTNNIQDQFTYHIGAGVDYILNENWLISAGYEFENFGNFTSGNGALTWAHTALHWKSYETNTVLIGVTYLI